MKRPLQNAWHVDVQEPTTVSIVVRLTMLAAALALWIGLARTTHDEMEHVVTSTLALIGMAATLSLLDTARRYFATHGAQRTLRKGELMSMLVVIADEGDGALTLAAAARAIQERQGTIDLQRIIDALSDLSAQGHCTAEYGDDGTIGLWQFARAGARTIESTHA
jgi:uncharacterized membrane protein